MTWFDYLFLFVLFVVQPAYGRHAWVKFQQSVADGHVPNRVRLYWETIVVQWASLVVLLVGWWWFDRSLADLGLHASFGVGFGVAAILCTAGLAALAWHAWQTRHASARERVAAREALGDLLPVLPQDDRDLRSFHVLSFTAGVVEEILYRGFVLWILVQLTPLWVAVLGSSVAFGLAHGYQGGGGILRTGGIGLLLACLYVGSGSIWLPMLFHALFDVAQGVQIRELFRGGDDAEAASSAPSARAA